MVYLQKKLEIWKDPNLGVSEHISQGDQLWVQEVYTYTLYVDICSTPMWTCTIHTCTCIIFLKCPPIMRLLAFTLFDVQMEIIFEEVTVWVWNANWESILASMEFHSSEDLGCSLQNPSLLLLHKGVWPFWSQISHMFWSLCTAVSTTTSLCGDLILLQGWDLRDYIRFPTVFSENTAFGWLYLSKSAAICLFA